jgi:branched-chain amino acid transport system substrate-binding protein
VKHKQLYPLALVLSFATSVAAQDITIGVTLGTTGASASVGLCHKNAFQLMPKTIGGQATKFIIYEDNGGSGAGSALPHTAPVVRGYKKQIYHNHGTVTREFIKAGGKFVEGAIATNGPLIVAEDLPADNPVKPVALDFIRRYEQTLGERSRNAFSGHSCDGYLLLDAAVPVAIKSANPGTRAFRGALRDALETSTTSLQHMASTT